MNTSPSVLERLRFLGIYVFFSNQIALYHGVMQCDKSEIQNALFSN